MTVKKIRKYITEWSLIITVSGSFVGRQQEFQRAGITTDFDSCHLYLITARPRMSIHPDSIQITENEIRGTLRLQCGEKFDEFPFVAPHSLSGSTPLTWTAEWPYEDFFIKDNYGKTISAGVVGLLNAWVADWPQEAKVHEVLYIGQAYGNSGDRTAWDRLKHHETAQMILAETRPDQQIWMTMASVTDLKLAPEIDPRNPTEKTSEEDDEHTKKVCDTIGSPGFWEKQAVALGEAGLIRYFQPKYNDKLKYNFPARNQVSLEAVRELDLHGLVVEFQGESVDGTYGTQTANSYSDLHFVGFSVHLDKNREVTLTLNAANSPLRTLLASTPED
jgi:hypothetical protein